MSRFFFDNGRFFLFADFHAFGASGVERTAFRRIHSARYVAVKNKFGGVLLVKSKSRNRSKERFGIGMEGVVEKVFGICNFAKISEIHNKDSVTEMFYNTEVMGDEEISKFLFTLGCFEGETISIVKKMHSNWIINIKGGRYGIDKDLAEAIEIF